MPTITRTTAMIHRIVVMPRRVPALRRPHTSGHPPRDGAGHRRRPLQDVTPGRRLRLANVTGG
jgi:hypothetical protein